MFDIDSSEHHEWLAVESNRLVAFFEAGAVNAEGGFSWLDTHGRPDGRRPEPLYTVSRLVHCFSVEHLLGRPGAARLAEHGLIQLNAKFSDRQHGGFFSSVARDGSVVSPRKETYGHAFALLAGASGMRAQMTGAAEVFDRAAAAIDDWLWEDQFGAASESYDGEWRVNENYRGQNCNMHLTEAYLAAYEATGDNEFLSRAERIAERLIRGAAREHSWRVPEHFTASWEVDREFGAASPNDPFRPFGTLVGHSLEWSRLLLQLHALRPECRWTLEAAVGLFDRAIRDGWDGERGGFVYSVDFAGVPVNRSRMHWTIAEAVGASVWLYRATHNDSYRQWYNTFWDYAQRCVLDREFGSWWHELDEYNRPAATTWDGKPDLYHAWQATLYARVLGDRGIADAAALGLIAVNQTAPAESCDIQVED